ncbi:MAG: TonB C-terminal domain-containing protein [Desulfopila sp.]|nr:TonB C-terminal domain-containing protein [Desulfopila sp.]
MKLLKNSEWSIPFNFALGLHIIVMAGAIYGPQYFNKKPLFPEIYTVDLISIEAPAQQSAPPSPPPAKIPTQQSAPEIQPAAKKEAVPVIETTEPDKTSEVVSDPISIKPLKRKIVRKEKPDPVLEQKKHLEQIKDKHLEEMRQAEQLAAEAARLAAMEAVNQLKSMLQENNTATAQANTAETRSTGASSRKSNSNVIENQYFASVFSALQPHWKLPEYKLWDKDLAATIIIQIAKDGSILHQFFEEKSGDRLFDQFVLKTLQDGSPLPPIPAALQTNSLELGLRFVPGSIQQ